MKIGLLAMSGVRAHDPKLLGMGLTLPGFVERSKAVARLPSLGLLYLAAVTPGGHEMRYFEAEGEGREAEKARMEDRGWRIAKSMGGSPMPREVGRVFRASDYPAVDVRGLPVPRYELLAGREYNRFTVQTSRGCPWRCEFCASTVMLGRAYRKRRVEDVVRDIEAVKGVAGRRPFVEFADDNTFVDKEWGKELCRRMRGMGVRWFTETDVTVAEDGELLGVMREAGCRQVLVGLESPSAGPLAGVEMRRDAKRRWAAKYGEAIRRIQGEGVTVNGCFVLGLDGHGPGIFKEVLEFAEEHSLYDVQITVLTAFPGTPLYGRLLREGRVVEPGRWELCTLFDVNYEPAGMTREELREGMYWLTERLYSAEGTGRRREGFFRAARRRRVGV